MDGRIHKVFKFLSHSRLEFLTHLTSIKQLVSLGIDPVFCEDTGEFDYQTIGRKIIGKALSARNPKESMNILRKQLKKPHDADVWLNDELLCLALFDLKSKWTLVPRSNVKLRNIKQFNHNVIKLLDKLIELHIIECKEPKNSSKLNYLTNCKSSYLHSYEHICPLCARPIALYHLYIKCLGIEDFYTILTIQNAWKQSDITAFKPFSSCKFHSIDNYNINIYDKWRVINNGPNSLHLKARQQSLFKASYERLILTLMRNGNTYKIYQIYKQLLDKMCNYISKKQIQCCNNQWSTNIRDVFFLLTSNQFATQCVWSILDVMYRDIEYFLGILEQLDMYRTIPHDETIHKSRWNWKNYEQIACGEILRLSSIMNISVFVDNEFILKPIDLLKNKSKICVLNADFEQQSNVNKTNPNPFDQLCQAWYYSVYDKDNNNNNNNNIHITSIGNLERSSKCFDNAFKLILNRVKCDISMLSYISDAYLLFFYYSLHLSRYKIKNGEKYFKQCFKFRPLNQYLHYQFSLYLYNVMNNSKDAWYHLKLAVNGHQKTKQCKFNSLYYQLLVDRKSNYQDTNSFNQMTNIHFLKFCKKLYFKCGKNPTCGNKKCCKAISRNKNGVKHTCKGCKVIMYCSRYCQKIDWKRNHKQECLAHGLKDVTPEEQQILNKAIIMWDVFLEG